MDLPSHPGADTDTAVDSNTDPDERGPGAMDLSGAVPAVSEPTAGGRSVRVWRGQPRSKVISSIVVSAAFALGIALVLVGVGNSVTGRDQSNLPAEIERVQPALGDKVLNQANIVVDLAPGYTGRLVIDDLELVTESTAQAEPAGGSGAPPTTAVFNPDVVRFDAGTNTLSFQPGPQSVIERFGVGRHLVRVIYWKQTESEVSSFSYTWYFDVTV
jgi:hypothetical protein